MGTFLKKISVFLLVFITLNTLSLILNTAPTWAAASLSLSPASLARSVNGTFSVDIVLDTGGDAAGGVTAILTYDTAKLQVQDDTSVTDPACTSAVNIRPGTIFGSGTAPFTNCVDSSLGQIRYDSGTLGTAYTGRGTLATITFRTVAVGTAPVNFVFNPSATTGTSLVAASTGPTNLLTAVYNGTYTITSGTTTTYLPPTGALENTLAVLGGGLAFLGIGVFLAKKFSWDMN